MNRVMIIGLDGAPYKFVAQLIERGELPNLRMVAKEGVIARLRSTIPPITCPAWPSMVTGLNPGKHGLFDFINVVHGNTRFSSSRNIQGMCIWDHLSNHGFRSVIVNVPATYPPYPIRGVMVSGMLTPEGADWIWPKDIRDEVDAVADGYIVNFDPRSKKYSQRMLYDRLLSVEIKRLRLFEYLLSRTDWHLSMVVIRGTDQIGHRYWRSAIVRDFYAEIDRMIGDLLKFRKDTNVFIVSDHGMTSLKKFVHVNEFLFREGYIAKKVLCTHQTMRDLKGKTRTYVIPKVISMMNLDPDFISKSIKREPLKSLIKILPYGLKNTIFFHPFQVDHARSRAFVYNFQNHLNTGIYLNADDGEREKILDELIIRFQSLRDPDTGMPVVLKVFRREEIFKGPFLTHAPHIYLILRRGYSIKGSFGEEVISSPETSAYGWSGIHTSSGIFMAFGPDIRSLGKMPERSIMDVAPTVLHALGVPIPAEIDGRPASKIFKHGRRPRFADLAEETAMKIQALKRIGAV